MKKKKKLIVNFTSHVTNLRLGFIAYLSAFLLVKSVLLFAMATFFDSDDITNDVVNRAESKQALRGINMEKRNPLLVSFKIRFLWSHMRPQKKPFYSLGKLEKKMSLFFGGLGTNESSG